MSDPRLSPAALEQEVRDAGSFFQAWINGDPSVDDATFEARFPRRTHPDFVMIMPGGGLIDGATVEEMLRDAYGSNGAFRLSQENFRVVAASGDFAVITYDEWQMNAHNAPRPNNGRRVTVTFTIAGSPLLRWLHLQHTWMPEEIVRAKFGGQL
jgi:hypothetical protein